MHKEKDTILLYSAEHILKVHISIKDRKTSTIDVS